VSLGDAEMGSLRERLNAWKIGDHDLLREAAGSAAGTELLAEQVKIRRDSPQGLYFVVSLGDGVGEAGIDELREASRATGPGSTDLRCAALCALTKRLRSGATPDLHRSLEDRSRTVREYAMCGLATYGTDAAWDSAYSVLATWLKNPTKRQAVVPDEVEAVCYLVRTGTPDRVRKVERLLASFAGRLEPHISAALSKAWPGWEREHLESPADFERLRTSTQAWFSLGSARLFAPA
jgi:hypothetical protein